MPQVLERKQLEDLQTALREVQELLARHRLVESLVDRQSAPSPNGDRDDDDRKAVVQDLVHRQHLAELRARLDALHSADVAYILEALPFDERLAIWELVKQERDGEILLEVSDAVRESLIRSMDSEELVAAAEGLDTDQLADLAADLPDDVIQDVFQALPIEEQIGRAHV